ncbi:MAG: hypothetical protein V4523_07975 [Pseudomonadota bacterium]
MSDLPKSISIATVSLYGVDMVVHQLDNGERVIEEASMLAFIEALNSLPSAPDESDHVQAAINEIFATPTRPTAKAGVV